MNFYLHANVQVTPENSLWVERGRLPHRIYCPKGMIKLKIYLSPSDQISNPYAYGDTNEAVQCRRIAAACKAALERNGFEVKTSFADGDSAMYERVRESNAWGADIHLCIHTNAGGGRGCVVFVASKSGERMSCAQPVFEELDAITPYRSVYGVREKQFYEIRNSSGLCLYCECEFHDSPELARWIIGHTDDIGEAICRGLCRAASRKYIEKGSESDMERWKTTDDIPSGYREMAQRYIDAGALRGKDGGALDLTEDMLRTLEIMRRYLEGEA